MTGADERVDEVSTSGVAEIGRREVPTLSDSRSSSRVVHIHAPIPEGVVEERLEIPEETPGGGQSRGGSRRRALCCDQARSSKECRQTSHAFHSSEPTTATGGPRRLSACHVDACRRCSSRRAFSSSAGAPPFSIGERMGRTPTACPRSGCPSVRGSWSPFRRRSQPERRFSPSTGTATAEPTAWDRSSRAALGTRQRLLLGRRMTRQTAPRGTDRRASNRGSTGR
jgi:hypothetical protein